MIVATAASLMALAAAVAAPIEAGSPPAPLSTSVLKQRLVEAQRRVWAWEIEYESARAVQVGAAAESRPHRLVAAKAPDRFFEWSAHYLPGLDWHDDPDQQRLTVAGDRMFVERPLDRTFNLQRLGPDEPLPGSAPYELLLIGLGWWPLDRRPSPILKDKLPASLTAVASSLAYQARPHLEQVGGRWCHVLECPEGDQLWLDVDRGCAVAARQIGYPDKARIHRVEFADFRELLPGIWAPFSVRNIHHERAPDGAPGRVVLDATLTVLRIRLNDAVDDARFRIEPQPGSVGLVDENPLRQAVPGGEDYLDEVAGWSRRYLRQAAPRPRQAGRIGWSDLAVGALIGVGAVITLTWRR